MAFCRVNNASYLFEDNNQVSYIKLWIKHDSSAKGVACFKKNIILEQRYRHFPAKATAPAFLLPTSLLQIIFAQKIFFSSRNLLKSRGNHFRLWKWSSTTWFITFVICRKKKLSAIDFNRCRKIKNILKSRAEEKKRTQMTQNNFGHYENMTKHIKRFWVDFPLGTSALFVRKAC